MELHLKRIFKGSEYIIGRLHIERDKLCDTLEPSLTRKAHPAIPAGRYKVVPHPSARFKGIRPLLENVPGRSAILIHEGNYPKDTQGCILVGQNSVKGMVTSSKATLAKLMPLIKDAWKKGEQVWITID